jgi:hypothetical protein
MAGYVSKDFIHTGCGLPLNPDAVYHKLPYSVQKNIKKAERNGVIVEKVTGSPDDIEILRSMWYDPDDPNMPGKLSRKEYMFIAKDSEGTPIGACILLPVDNHLFLNNLAGSPDGKALRVQDYILWHCVNYFSDSGYKYIDVGVSYRPSLYSFFKKWRVISYPVIFNKPEIPVYIPPTPFNSEKYNPAADDNKIKSANDLLKLMTSADTFTFVPNGYIAESILDQNGYKIINQTFNFPEIPENTPCYVDLPKLFAVQFGAIIFNISISDADMWNKYSSLDIFKRDLVLSNLANELKILDEIIETRRFNFGYLNTLFALEDISAKETEERIPSMYYFSHGQNGRFSGKLTNLVFSMSSIKKAA